MSQRGAHGIRRLSKADKILLFSERPRGNSHANIETQFILGAVGGLLAVTAVWQQAPCETEQTNSSTAPRWHSLRGPNGRPGLVKDQERDYTGSTPLKDPVLSPLCADQRGFSATLHYQRTRSSFEWPDHSPSCLSSRWCRCATGRLRSVATPLLEQSQIAGDRGSPPTHGRILRETAPQIAVHSRILRNASSMASRVAIVCMSARMV